MKAKELIPLAESFTDHVHWDILALQEGAKDYAVGITQEQGMHVLSGPPGPTGATQLIMNQRIGSRVRKTVSHQHFALAEIGMVPPLILLSLYLPAFSTHGQHSFEDVLDAFQTELKSMQEAHPGSFVLGGADCNTELKPAKGHIGPYVGASDRPQDEDRSHQLLGLLSSAGLTAATSYVDLGPTRYPWEGLQPKQRPSTIDYIFTSSKLKYNIHTTHRPTPDTTTDHQPIGLTAKAPWKSRKDRRRQFEQHLKHQQPNFRRFPSHWQPTNEVAFRLQVRNLTFSSLDEVAPALSELAASQCSYEQAVTAKKQTLMSGANNASDPVVRQAYQVHLRAHRLEQRERRELDKLLAWARGDNWGFSKQIKVPTRMQIPDTINEEPDRGNWGKVLERYVSQLYSCQDTEEAAIHHTLWRIADKATSSTRPPLTCEPNELRDLLKSIPTGKAAGPDGIPSQILKALTMKQIKNLATLFTQLANTPDYRPPTRPELWTLATVILLPKEARAEHLDRYRAIALMCQLQKLFAKWLVINLIPAIDPVISEHQSGYRRGRQASEVLFTVQKMIEIAHEWNQPLVLLKLDLRKAFDTLKQSSILQALEEAQLHPMLTLNIARELVGNYLSPQLYGCSSEKAIPQKRGTKQGSPESGLLFIHTINHALQPLKNKWDQDADGFPLKDGPLNHLIFVDDLILVGTSHAMVARMLQEATQALRVIGLEINPDKTSYLTTTPKASPTLPGNSANQTGLKILGRTFTLGDSTLEDMNRKIATAWGKFNRLRHVLGANTPLQHRLRIFKACVGQSLLWAAETWHVTRRRLQKMRGVELQMMKTLIKRPYFPQDIPDSEKHAQHKAHIRQTLEEHKYIGLDRTWLKKYHGWAGHLGRLDEQRIAKRAMRTQNVSWWKTQQANPEGHRHSKRAGNLSRWEGVLCRHHPCHDRWWEATRDRERWQKSFPEFERRTFGPHCPHNLAPKTPPENPGVSPQEATPQDSERDTQGDGEGARQGHLTRQRGRDDQSRGLHKRTRTPKALEGEGSRAPPKHPRR